MPKWAVLIVLVLLLAGVCGVLVYRFLLIRINGGTQGMVATP